MDSLRAIYGFDCRHKWLNVKVMRYECCHLGAGDIIRIDTSRLMWTTFIPPPSGMSAPSASDGDPQLGPSKESGTFRPVAACLRTSDKQTHSYITANTKRAPLQFHKLLLLKATKQPPRISSLLSAVHHRHPEGGQHQNINGVCSPGGGADPSVSSGRGVTTPRVWNRKKINGEDLKTLSRDVPLWYKPPRQAKSEFSKFRFFQFQTTFPFFQFKSVQDFLKVCMFFSSKTLLRSPSPPLCTHRRRQQALALQTNIWPSAACRSRLADWGFTAN